jgi:hypothetical protein
VAGSASRNNADDSGSVMEVPLSAAVEKVRDMITAARRARTPFIRTSGFKRRRSFKSQPKCRRLLRLVVGLEQFMPWRA